MFRNRSSTQKPNDELYATFKQNFPGLAVRHDTATSSTAPSSGTISTSNAEPPPAVEASALGGHGESKDDQLTPRGSAEQWHFTPSLLDTSSFSFASFANQPPSYYTPNSGLNAVYHNQTAGDLHTPGLSFHLGTPLSMSMSEDALHAASFDMHGFGTEMFQNPAFQNATTYPQQHQTFPPSMLVHQDSGYEPMEGSPGENADGNPGLGADSQIAFQRSRGLEGSMAAPPLPFAEKFRYHVTLNAPTAMVRQVDEIPVTYLNKGQAYTISIVDSASRAPFAGPVKYRTVIRISFEDEQQRQRPSACWQLWKEGRGLAEAHQRGGKLQAVEYVDPHPGAEDDPRRPRIELESASFDSFAVTWAPSTVNANAECSVAVRFNFLSTDFSHSKGVKGIPVRLCAKTEVLSSSTPESPPGSSPEVCYCKVKLFRDHGAERKLSNDVAHVKKTIDKLQQQIAQIESGMKDFGKRKRTASMAGKSGGERPSKVLKHKRTWSVSSQGSSGRPAAEEDLHHKLATAQDMFTSTRPASVLYLKGMEQDDPDMFPVSLPSGQQDLGKPEFRRQESWDQRQSGDVSPTGSPVASPATSSQSIPEKPGLRRLSTFKSSRQASSDWPLSATVPASEFSTAFSQMSPTMPRKVRKSHTFNDLPDWIEAVGVDSSYIPPPEPLSKPIACFYVLIKLSGNEAKDDYYRAIYLMQRTVGDLISNIASKCDVNPARIMTSLRINGKGLKILVDDELVREIPEGQDMIVEFNETKTENQVKDEPGASLPEDTNLFASPQSTPLEMRLIF